MTELLTTQQAADALPVGVERVRVMVRQVCPQCNGRGAGCPRCRGTGHKLPYVEAGRSGHGAIKMIHDWALELPDVAHPAVGAPCTVPGVTIAKIGRGNYTVYVEGERRGEVYRVNEKRRSWEWSSEGETGGLFRSRKAALLAMLAS